MVKNFTLSTGTVYVVYWECMDGWQTASGAPGGLVQCTGSTWVTTNDTCVKVPRDCSEVAASNLTNMNGQIYNIRPSNTTITAMCDLTTMVEGADGGWTLILRHQSQVQDLYLTPQQYMEVVGKPSNNITDPSYFIGLQNLEGLNWRQNGSQEPLVFKFVLEDVNAVLTSTACGPIVITPSNYTLQSVGQCLGNASDQVSGTVGSSFCNNTSSSGPCWWCSGANSSTCQNGLLTSASPVWGSSTLKSVMVWARPLSYIPGCQTAPQVSLATTDWQSRVWKVGDTVTATCMGGFASSAGNVTFPVTCTLVGWQQVVCVRGKYSIPFYYSLYSKYICCPDI
nr:uncharacterized protein LOC123771170 [Procambarus clarkii]